MENMQDKNLNNLNNEEIVENLTSNQTIMNKTVINLLENQSGEKTSIIDDIFNSNIGNDRYLTFALNKEPKISEGIHKYVLRGVRREDNQKTAYGLKDQVIYSYDVINENGSVVSIIDRNNISDSNKSKFKKNLKSYCDALGVTRINLKNLINIKGELRIVHNTDEEGNIYENVAEIYPINEFENGIDIGGATDEIDV